jgi:thiamine biosynthesis lipoprotein
MRHAEHVMGTVVSFDVRGDASGLRRACRTLHRADAVFSTWRDDTPLSRLRRGEIGLAQAPPEVASVLALCEEAKRLTGGWFDPWAMPGGVDPTGLVKGWAAERAAERLREGGASAAMVNAAGDVMTFGERPWRIGIRDPLAPDQIACVIETRGAVATSATYERGEHVLDPYTGAAATAALSATVAGPSLALADALATGLLAAGIEGLNCISEAEGYEALLFAPDGERLTTGGFSAVG